MNNAAKLRIAVLISGSGTNLQAILDAIDSGELPVEIAAVISDKPAAYGLERARSVGVKAIAIDFAAHTSRADYNAALDAALAEIDPQLIVLAGYMRILPDPTVNHYLGRMINIHPSLLPAYPGLNTYARALQAGERHHGTTVHFVIPELDAGPAILQYRVSIDATDTEDTLCEKTQRGEYIIYPQVIRWFAEGRVAMENHPDCRTIMDGQPISQPIVIDADENTHP